MGQVKSGTGNIIESHTDVGGWTEYLQAGSQIFDSDQDGMRTLWED